MKGREANSKGAVSADLLVCFPSRAHLTLMPKPICSPARHSESSKRHSKINRLQHHHHIKKSSTRNGGQGSPLLWGKSSKSMDDEIAEPTSPKVTCAGQIKVGPKTTSCRSWQSVMEEIEKIHNDRNRRKRSSWVESLGFKKEIVQFLTYLRSIHFDFRCFGSFPAESDITTDDEEGEDELEGYQENHAGIEANDSEASKTVFSKWFMLLHEDQEVQHSNRFCIEDERKKGKLFEEGSNEPTVPPPNALLLMRCRTAPAKSWLEEKEQQQEENEEKDENDNEEQDGTEKEAQKGRSLRSLMEEEKRNKENLVVMRYESDNYKISCDIAKETWLVGGLKDSLSIRSRSWKR